MKRQISIVACLLMLLAVVFAVASCTQPEAAHVHEYAETVIKEATCTDKGAVEFTCSCGEDKYTNETAAKGHTIITLEAVEPTCTTAGKTAGKQCSDCGLVIVEQSVIAPIGHKLGAAATCTEPQVCAYGCGQVFVEALGHSGPAPTCTEDSICVRCDVKLEDALGHSPINDATCTEDSICGVCDAVVVEALGHALEYDCCSGWCFNCGMEYLEATAEHEYYYPCDIMCINCYEFDFSRQHNMIDVEAKESTCTVNGNDKYSYCEYCGYCEDEFGNMSGIPSLTRPLAEHEYFTECDPVCMNCYQLTNEEAACSVIHVDAKAPTCTEFGNIEYWYCEYCGKACDNAELTGMPLNMMMVRVPETGHAYFYECDGWCMNCYEFTNEEAAHSLTHVAAVDPTCTENGNIEYWQCEYCGGCWDNAQAMYMPLNRMMVIRAALGHNYTVECDAVCTVCFEINEDNTHNIVKVTKKAATCTEDGANIDYWTCTYCDLCWANEALTIPTNKATVAIPNFGGHKGHEADFICDTCKKVVLPAAGEALTIPQANALAKAVGTAYTSGKYYVTGYVKLVENTTYGNMYLVDDEGNEFYIYGLYSSNGSTRYDAMSTKPVKGDELTVYTILGVYGSTAQGKNAWIDELVQHTTHVWTDATCTAPKTCVRCEKVEGDPIAHTFVAGFCAVCGAKEGSRLEWVLVTDVNNLSAGDQIVLVAKNYDYAMSTTQNGNNRGSVAITKSGNSVTINDSVQVVTLEASGAASFPWNLKVGEGKYLYAESTSSNYLRTGSKGYNNATWSISIASTGVATIKANQTNKNWLRFNNSNSPKLFSCYGSGQTDVAIYKLTEVV